MRTSPWAQEDHPACPGLVGNWLSRVQLASIHSALHQEGPEEGRILSRCCTPGLVVARRGRSPTRGCAPKREGLSAALSPRVTSSTRWLAMRFKTSCCSRACRP